MRSMWNGSLSFGLVNIPVKMYAATQGKDLRFNQLHSVCHTPIKYEKVCPHCQRAVVPEEIVRGYSYEPGRYVIIQDEEWESFAAQATRTVDILRFVELREIDPIYYEKTYYLEPTDTGGKAYRLLQEALLQSGKIAVAEITIRSKPSLAVVRVYHEVLALETIFYPDEVRDYTHLAQVRAPVSPRELEVALSLIETLTEPFNPEHYSDERRLGLQELIEKKIQGQQIVQVQQPAAEKAPVDLLAALQASIQAQQAKGAKAPGGLRH
ncbi:MAG: Ku protein [Bacillota bacterium]|jgi:DNA end-binding protein Ku|nr:Ku protein [Bacillota bacterium]HHT91441.1 Ku protein [Bacillota bacterium]